MWSGQSNPCCSVWLPDWALLGPKKGSEQWTLTQMSRECFCFTGRARLLPMVGSKNHPLASGLNNLWTERLKAAGLFAFASGSTIAGSHGAGCVHSIFQSFSSPDKGLIAFPPRKQRGGKKKKRQDFLLFKRCPLSFGSCPLQLQCGETSPG